MEPIVRSGLMYVSKDQVKAIRKLLREAWLKLDVLFYYGRWEALLNINTEEAAHKALQLRLDSPPGYDYIQDGFEGNNFADVEEQAAQSYAAILPPTEPFVKTEVIQEVGTAMAGEAED
eukprot:1481625-Amphidinium_carterae.1